MLIVFNDVPLMFSYHGVYVVLKSSSGLSLMFFLLEAGFSSFSNFFCSVCVQFNFIHRCLGYPRFCRFVMWSLIVL